MKKIVITLLCIVLFLAGGFLCWRYFNDNLMDYRAYAEFETKGSELYFTDNAFAEKNMLGIGVYTVNDDGKVSELYSEKATDRDIVYANGDCIILANDTALSAYCVDEKFSMSFEVEGRFISAHNFGDYICVKVIDNNGKIVLYRYSSNEGVVNLKERYDFDFVDYCIDPVKNKEYFISYVLMGEYVKINIITCINGVVLPNSFIEIDNTVYRDFDYVNDMFVFYTDTSMLFINTETQIRNTQYVFDMDKVKKLVYRDKIAYIMENAYFNGVSNVYIASASSVSYEKMLGYEDISKYSDKIVYVTDKYVKQYTFGSALLNDTVLFSDAEMQGIYIMGNVIAVKKSDRIVFMKTNK